MKNRLSKKSHWDEVHKNWISFSNIINNYPLLYWLETYQFIYSCKKYINFKYKNIFEIWCAPGNYLIKFNKLFNLSINWIEYSKEWINSLEMNFKNNNLKNNIIFWDFFDKKFLNDNQEKYDVVYSVWFIEHFDNPEESINNHFKITKKWGLVIIAIPNFKYLNKYLTEKSIIDIHNLNIMNTSELKKYFKDFDVLEIKYNWGLFNIGLFSYKNIILEKIRFIIFLIQRFIIDPIFILFLRLWLDLSNKYTSPQILIICRKN